MGDIRVVGEIFGDRVISQKIYVRTPNLFRIRVKVGTYQRVNSGVLFVLLLSEAGETLRQMELPCSELEDNSWVDFSFDPILDSSNKNFFIRFFCVGNTYKESPTLYYTSEGNEEFKINKTSFRGSLLLKYYTNFSVENLMKNPPLVTVVMATYNVDPIFLEKTINSVINQSYDNWELCITDDFSTNLETIYFLKKLKNKKIRIGYNQKNLGISESLNKSCAKAKGKYLVFLDHDDELLPNSLLEVMIRAYETKSPFIYSDESTIDPDGNVLHTNYKPDFSKNLLLAQNYICHLVCMSKDLFINIGGFKKEFDGSQDHDLFLKASEKTENIQHIPEVLYLWKAVPGSTAQTLDNKSYALDAGRRCVQECLKRRGLKGSVCLGKSPGTYKVNLDISENPEVNIIIPFKDKLDVLDKCLRSIFKKTIYKNFRVTCIDNGSQDKNLKNLMLEYISKFKNIFFCKDTSPFNFSAIMNKAVRGSPCEYVVLLNNDTEVISENWIEELLQHAQKKEVGAVGCKLLYPDNRIQHGGVIVGLGGVAGHAYHLADKDYSGYFSRGSCVHEVGAVTAACIMTKKSVFLESGGLDEVNLKIAFNDVDYCLNLLNLGYLVIYNPDCILYHHESLSRGLEDTPEKLKRFKGECQWFCKKHELFLKKGDPYYNKNLSLLEAYRGNNEKNR